MELAKVLALNDQGTEVELAGPLVLVHFGVHQGEVVQRHGDLVVVLAIVPLLNVQRVQVHRLGFFELRVVRRVEKPEVVVGYGNVRLALRKTCKDLERCATERGGDFKSKDAQRT